MMMNSNTSAPAMYAQADGFFESIVRSAEVCIIVRDLQSRIMCWNLGAEYLFGYTEQEMLGQSILRLFPEDKLQEEPIILDQIRKALHVQKFQTTRLKKDQTEIPVLITPSPIKDQAGKVIGASAVIIDISVQKSVEDKLQYLYDNNPIMLMTLCNE